MSEIINKCFGTEKLYLSTKLQSNFFLQAFSSIHPLTSILYFIYKILINKMHKEGKAALKILNYYQTLPL